MKRIKYSLFILFAVALSSCSSWLEVNSKDKVLETTIFKDKAGFLKALNGVYVELVNESLYGSDLSYGTIDVMAQYYNVKGNSNSPYWIYSFYSYNEVKAKEKFDKVWSKAYNMIANCNIILEHCADDKGVLNDSYKSLIKGEALALRAMLHFDLLRLFGPIYSDETKDQMAVPYMMDSEQQNKPLKSSSEVMQLVKEDLKAAEVLLKSCDPIITEGVRNYPNNMGNNEMFYRQYRLNYYAVCALMARANLWSGDKTDALEYANRVIAVGEKIFPFVTMEEANHATKPNRVFSSEVIFALYNMSRSSVYDSRYSNALKSFDILTVAGKERLDELYSDENDFRYKMWNSDPTHKFYFRKFEEVANDNDVSMAFRYMMPLIRLSEMYLIAAESTSDIDYAKKCINMVRFNRGSFDLDITESNLEENITKEFRKEMICEGQMFFFYKRKGVKFIPDGALVSGNMSMDLKNYVVPLPESETSQREEI